MKKIILLILSIILILIIIVGTTYSLYYKENYTANQNYELGTLDIVMEKNQDSVVITNSFPMEDSYAVENLVPYTFTIKNNGNLDYRFDLMLVPSNEENQISSEYIKIKLGDDGEIKKLSDLNKGVILSNQYLKATANLPLNLKVWIDVNIPNTEMGKTFKAILEINGKATMPNQSSETLDSYTQLVNLNLNSSLKTSPPDFSKVTPYLLDDGSYDSSATGIYEGEDEFGKTYYFRGDVVNNYVNFAGFWWRIIRINGDGTIRIIYDGKRAYENGYSSTNRLIRESVEFNSQNNDNAYVGWMFGTPSASDYNDAHTNTTPSTLKSFLDTWYETNIKNPGLGIYVADAIYCNDRSLPNKDDESKKGFGNATTEYAAYARIYNDLNNPKPTFKCPKDNDKFTVSDTIGNGALTNPIGLITADEVVFAGMSFRNASVSNHNKVEKSYLYVGSAYFTMTPLRYNDTDLANIIYSTSSAYMGNDKVSRQIYVKPVISLKANAIKYGTGAATDPFRVSNDVSSITEEELG